MIHLRPYYLYSLLRQLAAGNEPIEENSLPQIVAKLKNSKFKEEIQLVNKFCDACKNCPKMYATPKGSLWGKGYMCVSTNTKERLNQVENQMRSILYDLDLHFGDSMQADLLIKRAIERRPYHYFHIPEWQQAYEKGITVFTEITDLQPEISEELKQNKQFYIY